jgi:4-hydroxy-tetrahydrodipicolinate synthase
VVANAFPEQFSSMVRFANNGNYMEASKIHYSLLEIIEQLFADGNPAGVKKALSIMQLVENIVRLPLVTVSDEVAKKLESLISKA